MYPLNPSIGEVFINSNSETCVWNGSTWVCTSTGGGTLPPVSSTSYEHIAVTNGQVSITLSSPVSNQTTSQVFLNGVKQLFTVDYSFFSNSVITWLGPNYQLESTDIFEIYKQ
jgi:hypothetical protein